MMCLATSTGVGRDGLPGWCVALSRPDESCISNRHADKVSLQASFLVYVLVLLSISNALFTFWRRRSYRLFEQSVDVPPPTPSAHRVKVDSSPMSSSPLRYMQAVLTSATASSRAYPDPEREVWELNLWDPKPFNLNIFTLFSPGHIVIYSLLLPPTASDPRPSVTVFTAMAFSALLSAQLWMLKASFSQQAKDSALIHGEVMNEYDTKYVHPNLIRPMRDVGIQTRVAGNTSRTNHTREIDVYTPTTIIKRGFRTHPNPNYAREYDPYGLASRPEDSKRNPGFPDTPTNGYVNRTTQSYSRPSTALTDFSSPLKPHHERLRERSPIKGDGGSMGVYSHAASPLRKAASSNHLKPLAGDLRRTTLGSPLNRRSASGPGGADPLDLARRRDTGRF